MVLSFYFAIRAHTVENNLCLDGVFPLGVLGVLADLLQGLARDILGGQSTANGAGLLGTQVNRLVLLALVQLAQVVLGLRVHHDVNTGDGLADDTAAKGHEKEECEISVRKNVAAWTDEGTHILESLEAAPPVTFWTRRLKSSVLRSSSCLESSFLSLVRNSEHLTLT